MKRVRLSILTFLLCALTPCAAQHYFGVTVAGHAPRFVDRSAFTHTQWTGGGDIGLTYEWHSNHFLIHTGVRYAFLPTSLAIDSQLLVQDMLDTRGVLFTYRGTLKQRQDAILTGQLNVPLYIGGAWSGFYCMGGLNLSVSIHSQARITAQLKTVGDYNGRYYADLEDMPNHGYHDFEPVSSRHMMPLPLIDVRVGAELGYMFPMRVSSLHIRRVPVMRIGVFAEYGLRNNRQQTTPPSARTTPDYEHYMSVTMTHLYASTDEPYATAHWLTFGLRMTFLFPVSDSANGHTCSCYAPWDEK